MIEQPGLYDDVIERVYHSDPVVEPSLSSSIAKLLVHRSARHAAFKHPRLNKHIAVEKYDAKKAIGTAAHRALLGVGHKIVQCPFPDFKTKAAQSMRDSALAEGSTPVLADDMNEVEMMVEAARDQLASTALAGYFDLPGKSEVTMVWRTPVPGFDPVWCRGRIDRLPDAVREGGHIIIADLKTTAGSSHWEEWESRAFEMAYDVQAAFYTLGLKAVIPAIRSTEFHFAVLEQKPPYGLTVQGIRDQSLVLEQAMLEVGVALQLWARCLSTGEWPSYDGEIRFLEKAPWRAIQAETRRMALQNIINRWQGINAEKRPDLLPAAE